jgi:hypothetical protein
MFQPESDSSTNPQQRNLLIVVAMTIAVILGGVLLIGRGGNTPIMVMIMLTVMMVMAFMVKLRRGLPLDSGNDKRKRTLPGQDMYSLIDRLVDDLDEDELDYLQQRLRDRMVDEPNPLPEDLDAALDRRAADREDGLR